EDAHNVPSISVTRPGRGSLRTVTRPGRGSLRTVTRPGRGSLRTVTRPGRGSLRPPAASRCSARKLAPRSFPRRPPAYVLTALVGRFHTCAQCCSPVNAARPSTLVAPQRWLRLNAACASTLLARVAQFPDVAHGRHHR